MATTYTNKQLVDASTILINPKGKTWSAADQSWATGAMLWLIQQQDFATEKLLLEPAIKLAKGLNYDTNPYKGPAPAPTPTPPVVVTPTPTPTPPIVVTPTPAPTTLIKDMAQLKAALLAAKGGEHFTLADGNYGSLSFSDKRYAAEVTVEGGRGAVFGSWSRLTNISKLRLKGMAFKHGTLVSNTNDLLVDPLGCEDLVLEDVEWVGTDHKGIGLWPKRGANKRLSILGGVARNLYFAHTLQNIAGFLVEGHLLTDIGSDGLKVSGGSDGIIRSCSFLDFHPVAGDHPDAIQVQAAIKNLLIELCHAKGRMQGFNRFAGGSVFSDLCTGILIRKNSLELDYANAFMWEYAQGVIEDNDLYTGAQGFKPLIRIPSTSKFTVQRNTIDGNPA